YDPANQIYTPLFSFDNEVTGQIPRGPLVLSSSGQLYGITTSGGVLGSGGTIFSYDILTASFTVLSNLQATALFNGVSSIILGSDGHLYGTSGGGGDHNNGTIYQFDLSTNTLTILYSLDDGNDEGDDPINPLLEIGTGLFYGTADNGGANNDGVFFSYDLNTSTFTKLADFQAATNGEFPRGTLLYASNQKIYGTTEEGGTEDVGTIFEYDPMTSTLTSIHSFDEDNGEEPISGLVEVGNGLLYGVTVRGGDNFDGIIYEYDINNSTFTNRATFDDDTNGEAPEGTLCLTSDGQLYGAGSSGGSAFDGTLFSYSPGDSVIHLEVTFNAPDDVFKPEEPLLLASDGILYGLSEGFGFNPGHLYSYDPGTDTYNVLRTFTTASDGENPRGQLVEVGSALYGVTYDGGTFNNGVIFSYEPSTATYAVEHNFETSTGERPGDNLILTSDGLLMGTTTFGADFSRGSVYEFDPTTNTFTSLASF
ncbi:MAG: choice-of-anchor tandem repeat GloVer-containing protein, partial [Bacteroidota bacterium]